MADLPSHDPATGELLGTVPLTDPDAVGAVVSRAREARGAWQALGLQGRAEVLRPVGAAILERADALAEQLHREMGKPLRPALSEVRSVGRGWSDELDRIVAALQPEVHDDGRTRSTVTWDPLGVTAAITPWNFPFSMPHWLVFPALVAGNTVVLKPSEHTPLTGQAYADALEAVLPEGVLQVVHGDGAQGRALVTSGVDLVAFTGSRRTGQHILAAAAPTLTRVLLELGGKDPVIVCADADVGRAARFVARNSFRNSGQVCVSCERVFVVDAVYDAFVQSLVAEGIRWTAGAGTGDRRDLGPMVHAGQRAVVTEQVRQAVDRGATLLVGGDDLDEADNPYLSPMVVADVPEDAALLTEETFGPVAVVCRVPDEDAAVAAANEGPFGLGAVVLCGDEARGRALARRLDAGMVGVNREAFGAVGTPWVGAKQSGYGFHSGPHGHRQFAQVRVMSERSPGA